MHYVSTWYSCSDVPCSLSLCFFSSLSLSATPPPLLVPNILPGTRVTKVKHRPIPSFFFFLFSSLAGSLVHGEVLSPSWFWQYQITDSGAKPPTTNNCIFLYQHQQTAVEPTHTERGTFERRKKKGLGAKLLCPRLARPIIPEPILPSPRSGMMEL